MPGFDSKDVEALFQRGKSTMLDLGPVWTLAEVKEETLGRTSLQY